MIARTGAARAFPVPRSMHADYWLDKWADDDIGFHQKEPNKRLVEHWPGLGIDPETPVFVPLCGKSPDMLWLHERGHPVFGVDLSEIACEAFFTDNRLPFERRAMERGVEFTGTGDASGLRLLAGDFFALAEVDTEHVHGVYDRASLIAMPPELRADYARQLAHLLPLRTRGLVIAIAYDQGKMKGPPFSVPDDEVRELLGGSFELEELSHRAGPDRLGNLAARGLDTLEERVYGVTRTPRT